MASPTTILAADIGGTSTRIGLFRIVDGRISLVARERYASRAAAGLEPILRRFRAVHDAPVAHACFGVAGPVVGNQADAPNLAWHVDGAALARELGLAHVMVINDLEANAHGIFELAPADFAVLNGGSPDAVGNIGVISAGTGLGEAGMYWDGRYHRPFACEGGHVDFAPRTDIETALLKHLREKVGAHVSWERVVSGPGLVNIYTFLRDSGAAPEPDWLARAIVADDPAAAISQAALEGKSDLCALALDTFVGAYGAEAGNLALKTMAVGGVYIGGGIAPKILPRLEAPAFMEAFVSKGRMRPLLEQIPVRVIANEHTALLGAARHAALQAQLATPARL